MISSGGFVWRSIWVGWFHDCSLRNRRYSCMGVLLSGVDRWVVVWVHDDGWNGPRMTSVVDLLVIKVCGARCQKLSEGMSEDCGSDSGGGIQKCLSIKINNP